MRAPDAFFVAVGSCWHERGGCFPQGTTGARFRIWSTGPRHAGAVLVDVPDDYRHKPVVSDGYPTYEGFFSPAQHRAIDKGAGEIGETSVVESLNTKWRQRPSGLVRRSCGARRRTENDLVERFFLLVEQHNIASQRRWERDRKTMQSGR